MRELEAEIISTAARQHGAFAARQFPGMPAHLSRARVDAGRWKRHHPGVFTVLGAPHTWHQRLWIALLIAGPGAVVGRRSAARLLHLTNRFGEVIDIIQPEGSAPRDQPRSSRRTTRLPASQVTVVDGFPVTTIDRTLFDLAGMTTAGRRRRGWDHLPEAMVERLVDDALVRKQTTIPRLTRTYLSLAGRGRPGSALMREILDARPLGHVPTESELEDLFIAFVDRYDLPRPTRQASLGSDRALIGRVDFLYEDARLVVEVDGRVFHEPRLVQLNDRQRELALLRVGWRFIRFGWHDLAHDAERIAESFRALLAAPVPRIA